MRFAGLTVTALCALLCCAAVPSALPTPAAPAVEALDEGTTPFTIDDVTRPPLSNEFRPVARMPATDRSIVRWYRFVSPRSNAPLLILSVDGATDDADLYVPRSNGSFGLERFGMRIPWSDREYQSEEPAVGLTPSMRAGKLYVRTYGPPTQPRFRTQSDFDQVESSIERWTFWFAGFFVAIGVSSLFLSIYLRERVFGLQAALMLGAVLFSLTDSQLAWRYVWPSASVDYAFADNVAFIVYLFVLILFSRSFLALERNQPKLDAALWVAFGLNVLVTFVAGPLAPDSRVLNALTPLINFLPFPLLLAASVLRSRDNFPQARFFTIGLTGMIAIFLAGGLLRNFAFARWGFVGGVAFDSLFFQFALADRLLSANRARDAAQRAALAAQEELVKSQREAIATLAEHNEAFSRFVPHEFLTLLDRDDIVAVQLGDHAEREMVVLFSDIRSFTALSERLTPQESFDFINAFLAQIGPVVREHGGFVDKYIGDAVMALFSGKADDAIDAAIALQQQVRRFNETRARALLRPVAVGVGLHRGPLMLGTIGEHKRLETTVIAGDVNVASRVEQLTKSLGAQIVISAAVESAIEDRSKYCLRPLGAIRVHGLSHNLAVYEVCDADDPEVLLAKMADLGSFSRGVESFNAGEYEVSLRLFESVAARNPKDLPAAYYRQRAAGAGEPGTEASPPP